MTHAFAKRAWLLICLVGALTPGFGADVTADGFSFLWWRDGPPYVRLATWKPPQEVLSFQSGSIGFELDTTTLRILHAGRFPAPLTKADVLADGRIALDQLPAPHLEISMTRGGVTWRCVGRSRRPKDEFFFPVRVIESGRFLQHVMITDLVFENAAHDRWPGGGTLTIALWPDRLTLRAELSGGTADDALSLELGDVRATAPGERAATLTAFNDAPGASSAPTVRGGSVAWDAERSAWRVNLQVPPWPDNRPDQNTTANLDRLDRWSFRVQNPTDQPMAFPLLFVPEPVRGITGLNVILCDAAGLPTGLPVQLSKNWHFRPEQGELPEQGLWLRAATELVLPPHTTRDFSVTLAYAQWGGVPAASHSQLSLVGWGHNQFWDQAAIGSFGESICFEPGRVQRRCFITDVRPLMTLGQDREPGGWPNNAGGGDILLWIDRAGQWRGFSGTKTEYRSSGPCLTDVVYHESIASGEITSRVRVRLPRSDDYLRVFFHLRFDVHASVRWQRLAFFQLGADNYNMTPARRVALGDRAGLREEWTTRPEKGVYERRSLPLTGEQPWISLHDINPAALAPAQAAATRGLIVRSWRSVLGGKAQATPHISAIGTELGKGTLATGVELSPPPGITEFVAGDYVEAELELVAFPAVAADYWGCNPSFRAALARHANTWTLVQHEAEGNSLTAQASSGTVLANYPLHVRVGPDDRAALTIKGGLGYVPVTFSGVTEPRNFRFQIDGRTVDQSVHGNDYWQTDFDPETQSWSLTFNVPLAAGPHTLEFAGAAARTAVSRPPIEAANAAPGTVKRKREPVLAP